MNMNEPVLFIIIPCYNEQEVLPVTVPLFLEKLISLVREDKISDNSRILFVNDGSKDDTWNIICQLALSDKHYTGICLSRNQGHQNAVLAGLMEAKDLCDITISIDCDGQDDLDAMGEMVNAYREGCEIVYGVRSSRASDTYFKRFTAESFYRLLNWLGVEVVFNHADYRLISSWALKELANFKEVNIFLRGMIPLVGFKSTSVYYERHERIAGKSHYPLKKMLALVSFLGVLWSVITWMRGDTVSGWASMTSIICFLGGVQLICIGILGEYVGKIYLETKERPRYIISERTVQGEKES